MVLFVSVPSETAAAMKNEPPLISFVGQPSCLLSFTDYFTKIMRLFQNLFGVVVLLVGVIPLVPLFAAEQVRPVASDPAEIDALVSSLGDFVQQYPAIFRTVRLSEDEKQALKTAIEQGIQLFEKTPSIEQKYWAAELLLKARLAQAREQPPSSTAELRAMEELIAFLEKKPEKIEILPVAKYFAIRYSIILLAKQGNDQPDPYQVKQAVKQYITENPGSLDTFGRVLVDVAVQYAAQDRRYTIETLKEIAEFYKHSKFRDDRAYANRLLDTSKRFEMIGHPITFSGVDLAGNRISSTDYKNKVVLVEFWASWCSPCVSMVPEMKRLYELYNKQGFEIVGVSIDKNKEDLAKFLEARKLPWKNLSDTATAEKGEIPLARQFGIFEYPTFMLIGRDGKLIATDLSMRTLDKELAKQFNNSSSKPRFDVTSAEKTNTLTPSLL